MPWLLKISYEDSELWIFEAVEGDLLFEGVDFTTYGEHLCNYKERISRA